MIPKVMIILKVDLTYFITSTVTVTFTVGLT